MTVPFREFNHVGDYGGSRFVDAARPELAVERAELMGQFLCATTRLFLHGLIGPDGAGRFSQEPNGDAPQNPLGSRFESVHHLFCNMVAAKLPVVISAQSPWMGGPVGGQVELTF